MVETSAAVAVGSNVPSRAGDCAATVRAAIAAIGATPGVRVVASSALHETDPVGPAPQARYINACVLVAASLPARELLGELLKIEQRFGRDRDAERRWGPRTLDLDLILYGSAVIDEPGLHVPHPRMHERLFVLGPLCEVWPGAVHPSLGRTVRELRDALGA